MLLDTGATKTIIRPDLAKKLDKSHLLPTKWRLRTATGEQATASGEIDLTIIVGNTTIKHRVLVAEVEDEFILGMDIMKKHGFKLDLKKGVMTVDEEELVLHPREDQAVRVLIAEDVTLPERSEVIVKGQLEGGFCEGNIVMLEPKNDDAKTGTGVVIGKSLIKVDKGIPVRIMNVNFYPVVLKKGTIVGECSAVSSIIRTVNAKENTSQTVPDNLMNQLSTSFKELTTDQRMKAKMLIGNYQDVFQFDKNSNGRTNVVHHKIDTGDARPIRQAARRLPLAKREEADRIIEDMKMEGVIEPSSSPWASPVVLVKKKDGSTRFCVDYRQLNNVTKKDSYPLPRIDDTLDTLAGSKMFSTLDLKSGYWQVDLDPKDKEKTAFTIGTGLWQFTVMPFGLCNAPATFERLMETVLAGLSWKTCLVYLDDIIVVGKTFEDHTKKLGEVFQRLRKANLKLSPKKCFLFQREVHYLGHVVSGKGIAVDPEKIRAVREWPVPRDKHEIRSFLGLCTYYRRYVPGFANIAKPLTRLTEEGRRFIWEMDCQDAFKQLKHSLTSAPVLSYPLPEGQFVLDTDASNVGIGGVLSQIQDGHERVISYFSKTLSKPERNYCVTRRELLAVVKSVEHFYKYLYGRRFLIRTDHAALKWLLQFKNPEGQVARWIERLQEYDFKIEHRAGTSHRNADALSRRPCQDECKHCSRLEERHTTVARTTVVDDSWQPEELQKDQENDPILKIILEWKSKGSKPVWEDVAAHSQTVKSYWAQWDSMVVENGLLKRVVENADGTERKTQLVIPKSRVPDVLKEIHDGSGGGHLGVNRTVDSLRRRFYWMNCNEDVKKWCKKCVVCAGSNGPQRKRRAPMRQYNVGSPFERIAIDVAGPFPESDEGNKYILVVMDYFSKWVEAYALPNQEAVTVAEVLVKECICRFGVPRELHSDQGRNFESALFQNICKILGINKTRTTALHPQSDGMVERMNRTINRHLSKVVSNHQRDWDRHLHLFLMAYRSSIHETTGQSPANILFGRELRLPCDLVFGSKPGEDLAGEDYVTDLRRRMDDTHEQVRRNMQDASDRMKDHYDIRAEKGGYQPGDLVWLYNPQRRRGYSPKLQRNWEGPYEIVKRINDVVYRIKKQPTGKPRVVHYNRLAPFAGDNHEDHGAATVRRTVAQEPTFEDFMEDYATGRKARHGVTKEEHRDLFTVPSEYSLGHCVAEDIKMSRGIASVFKAKFGRQQELANQRPSVGKTLQLRDNDVEHQRYIYYLVTKPRSYQKPFYRNLWDSMCDLRNHLLENDIMKLAVPKLGCGLDGLDWRIVRNMLEILFRYTGVEILVCSFNPNGQDERERTIDCHFFNTSRCTRGDTCRFRHELIRDESVLRREQCNVR